MQDTAVCQATSSDSQSASIPTFSTLGLHGSEGSKESFAKILGYWNDYKSTSQSACKLEIATINAPVPRETGYSWWSMPPFVRSFNATVYEGYESSRQVVIDNMPGMDLVVGHSQGAILIAAMLADKSLSQYTPRVGYILVGVAWPNPLTSQFESLRFDDEKPRVLVVIGEADTINEPVQGERVANALEKAGAQVTRLYHSGGHSMPTRDASVMARIQEWIMQGDK
jgi:predicted esterase